MKFISHRGNINGPDSDKENNINHIIHVLNNFNYDVELDLRYNTSTNLLEIGHDYPRDSDILNINEFINIFKNYSDRLWLHCKNIDAIFLLSSLEIKFNYFGHSDDEFVLTSFGNVFTKPGVLHKNAIAVMPELFSNKIDNSIFLSQGILTDFPFKYETHYYSIRS